MGTDAKDDKGLGRREFIKLGAGGLAVSLTACVASPVEDTPSAAGAEQGTAPMTPPDLGDLVDPTRLPTGNWQEPWVWRPEHWPGAPLELNVVANQNPGHSTSPGNPTPSSSTPARRPTST